MVATPPTLQLDLASARSPEFPPVKLPQHAGVAFALLNDFLQFADFLGGLLDIKRNVFSLPGCGHYKLLVQGFHILRSQTGVIPKRAAVKLEMKLRAMLRC